MTTRSGDSISGIRRSFAHRVNTQLQGSWWRLFTSKPGAVRSWCVSFPKKETIIFRILPVLISGSTRIFRRGKAKVTLGTSGYLPEKDWKPLNRKVYRLEASIAPLGEEERVGDPHYLDFYLVTFGGNHNYMFQAWNKGANHVTFRKQAEDMIKSFQLGPFDKPRSRAPSASPAVGPSGGSASPVTDRPAAETPGANSEIREAAPASIPAGSSPRAPTHHDGKHPWIKAALTGLRRARFCGPSRSEHRRATRYRTLHHADPFLSTLRK